MKPPIKMNLMGGLGNQLFQLATGLEVAHRAGTTLVLDLSWYQQKARRSEGLTLRDFELADVAEGLVCVNREPTARQSLVRHGRDVFVRRIPSRLGRLLPHIYVESSPNFDKSVLELKAGTELLGYFSSWKYFQKIQSEIRGRISHAVGGSPWLDRELAEIQASEPIVLHVRRGDYLTLSSTYGHLTPAYYLRGVDMLRRLGHLGEIWLMSDDPEGAFTWLSPHLGLDRVIQPPSSSTSLESLFLMSAAKSLVIANSTFSWWAAFLDDRSDRPVIAPRPYWANEDTEEPRDLLLPGWISLDCRSQ